MFINKRIQYLLPIFFIITYKIHVILIISEVFYNDTEVFFIIFIWKNKLLKIAK